MLKTNIRFFFLQFGSGFKKMSAPVGAVGVLLPSVGSAPGGRLRCPAQALCPALCAVVPTAQRLLPRTRVAPAAQAESESVCRVTPQGGRESLFGGRKGPGGAAPAG